MTKLEIALFIIASVAVCLNFVWMYLAYRERYWCKKNEELFRQHAELWFKTPHGRQSAVHLRTEFGIIIHKDGTIERES